jgi:mono/diheme cytochrome c family protein
MNHYVNKLFVGIIILASLASCGGSGEKSSSNAQNSEAPQVVKKANPKGIGEVKNVKLTDPLEESMVTTGKGIYEMKCSACHKITDQRVVGPGWAGVTNRRTPEWIMNMITNVDVMLAEDPAAQKLLEECLTRMPNQGVSTGDARSLLEYMRKNDMEQVGKKDEAAI